MQKQGRDRKEERDVKPMYIFCDSPFSSFWSLIRKATDDFFFDMEHFRVNFTALIISSRKKNKLCDCVSHDIYYKLLSLCHISLFPHPPPHAKHWRTQKLRDTYLVSTTMCSLWSPFMLFHVLYSANINISMMAYPMADNCPPRSVRTV